MDEQESRPQQVALSERCDRRGMGALIPPGKSGGGKRTVIMREVVNGLCTFCTQLARSQRSMSRIQPRLFLADSRSLPAHAAIPSSCRRPRAWSSTAGRTMSVSALRIWVAPCAVRAAGNCCVRRKQIKGAFAVGTRLSFAGSNSRANYFSRGRWICVDGALAAQHLAIRFCACGEEFLRVRQHCVREKWS